MQYLVKGGTAGLPQVDATVQSNRDDELRVLVRSPQAQIKVEVSPVLRGTVHHPLERDVVPLVEDEFGFASIPVVSLPDLNLKARRNRWAFLFLPFVQSLALALLCRLSNSCTDIPRVKRRFQHGH
jgi:hypothetical protein